MVMSIWKQDQFVPRRLVRPDHLVEGGIDRRHAACDGMLAGSKAAGGW